MNNEFGIMWKEALVVSLQVLFSYFPEGTEEKTKNRKEYGWYPCRDWKLTSPKYKKKKIKLV
jgi:hypothetical protein